MWRPTCGTRPSPPTVDGMAYAWSEYSDGELRRRAAPDRRRRVARPGPPAHRRHRLRAAPQPGHDHRRPAVVRLRRDHRARARRQRPTHLRPRPGAGHPSDERDGMRDPGDSVPPELLPEVSAEIRVVCVGDERAGGAARRARPRARRRPVGDAPAAGHSGRWPGCRLPHPPPAAADDLLLGGGRPGARPVRAGGRRSRSPAPTPPSRRCRSPAGEPGWSSPPSPTDGWTAPCTGPRGSAAASARTWPTTTAP